MFTLNPKLLTTTTLPRIIAAGALRSGNTLIKGAARADIG